MEPVRKRVRPSPPPPLRLLGREEYHKWLEEQKPKDEIDKGWSSRIRRAGKKFIKEQLLGFVDGGWHSLQVFRSDIPGLDEARESILAGGKVTQAHRDCVLILVTHLFEDEVTAIRRAAARQVTPPLVDGFYVDLGNGFRLGVTSQQRVHRIFRTWIRDNDVGYDGMMERMAQVGFHQYTNIVDQLADAKLVYLDWNCGNMGITETSKLQLIDFGCTTMFPPVTLRDPKNKEIRRELGLVWRKAIMYQNMASSWTRLVSGYKEFRRKMLYPAKKAADHHVKLCHDFLTQHAHPDTDFEQVLSAFPYPVSE